MKDVNQTKKHLMDELTELRSQNAALQKSITGSISAELAAEEARRYAESIVGTVREPLLVLAADLKIISANRNFYRTFKVTPGETIGSFIYDLGNKQWDIPKLRELLEEVLPEKQAFDDFEVDHHFEDIGHKTMLLNARQIHRKYIGAMIILLAIEDITERKRLESLLIDSEQQYRRLFETASDGIVLLEKREGKITNANPATEKLLGYTEKECIGNNLQDIGVVLDTNDFRTTMQNLNKSGILNYRNVTVETKSGQHTDTEIYLVDRAKLVQCNIRDITVHTTERKRAGEDLRESEERLRDIIFSIADWVWEVDENGVYTYISQKGVDLFGKTRREIIGKTPFDFMPPDEAKRVAAIFSEIVANKAPIKDLENWNIRVDGERICLLTNGVPILDDEGNLKGYRGVDKDITERKRAEEALIVANKELVFQNEEKEKREAALKKMLIERKQAEEDIHRLYGDAQRRAEHLIAMQEIDRAVLNSLDIALTMPLILAHVQARLNVDATDILLLNPHSHALTFAAGRGFRTEALKKTRLRLGEGNAGRAALERQIVNIPDLRTAGDAFSHAPLLKGEDFVAYYAAPLIAKGLVKGVLEIFHRAPFTPDDEWLAFFQMLAEQTALAIDSALLFTDLQRSNVDLSVAYDATIEGWAKALDLRDKETEGHSRRVTEMTERIARAMDFSEADLVHVRRGALLHDLGKLGIPDGILQKPGPLTEEEWVIMRSHPQMAFDLLSPIAYLRPALDIPYCHHEKLDGSGYPRGMKGDQIPLSARIFAVVDVWDALRSDRPYRAAMPPEKCRAIIEDGVGRHFDPQVVEAFFQEIQTGGET